MVVYTQAIHYILRLYILQLYELELYILRKLYDIFDFFILFFLKIHFFEKWYFSKRVLREI